MTTKEDNYFMWIDSPLFGSIRLQHHNGLIEAVDDARFKWSIGKHLVSVEQWITRKEAEDKRNREEAQRNLFELEKQRSMLWDEECKKRAVLMEMEFGDKTFSDYDNM